MQQRCVANMCEQTFHSLRLAVQCEIENHHFKTAKSTLSDSVLNSKKLPFDML